MRSQLGKIKIHKDLAFLLDLPKTDISSSIVKYLIKPGIYEEIKALTPPFSVYYTCLTYDYQGKFIKKYNKVIKSNGDTLEKTAVDSMKLYEQAWFNIRNDENGDKEDLEQPDSPGTHYHITIDKIEFKNSESILAKRNVFNQNRLKGKELFEEGKFDLAFKVYKNTVNMTQTFSKKIFTEQECQQISEMNIAAKQNALKCFAKLKDPQDIKSLSDFAGSYVDCLTKKRPQDHLTYFLKAKYLLKIRYFTDSLEAATKSYEIQNQAVTMQFIRQIESELSKKGKVKAQR